jgi:hypothetical protein
MQRSPIVTFAPRSFILHYRFFRLSPSLVINVPIIKDLSLSQKIHYIQPFTSPSLTFTFSPPPPPAFTDSSRTDQAAATLSAFARAAPARAGNTSDRTPALPSCPRADQASSFEFTAAPINSQRRPPLCILTLSPLGGSSVTHSPPFFGGFIQAPRARGRHSHTNTPPYVCCLQQALARASILVAQLGQSPEVRLIIVAGYHRYHVTHPRM